MTERCRVFVPGHVTGFFRVHRSADPMAAGSQGAGVTVTDGVTVEVTRAESPELGVNGEPTDMEPVERVIEALDATPLVDVTTALPIGGGFGVSGATALGTAYGVNRVFDCERSENDLVGIAHAAEVESGTGLGDVVAQHRGGAPIRLAAGAPGHGRLDGIPDRRRLEYVSFGELSTTEVLAGDTQAIDQAGEAALASLREQPTLERFMAASREFSRESGLLTDDLEAVIEDVQSVGGEAAMAMLGQTVFALETGLSDAGYDAVSCEISGSGVRIE